MKRVRKRSLPIGRICLYNDVNLENMTSQGQNVAAPHVYDSWSRHTLVGQASHLRADIQSAQRRFETGARLEKPPHGESGFRYRIRAL